MKPNSYALTSLKIWLILFALIPIMLLFVTSFLTYNDDTLVTLPLTLKNYLDILSPLYGKVFLRSLLLSLITTSMCLLIAYPFCYFVIHSRCKSLLLLLVIIPFWTSSLIRTYAMIALLKGRGLLNLVLLKLHLIDTPLTILYTNTAVIIGLAYNLLPFMILPLYNNMERFDFRLFEAAKDLGANKYIQITRVLVPNTLAGIVAGCLMVFLPSMTLFYIPTILGGAKSVLVGNVIQDQFLVLGNWPQGAATSMLLTLTLLLLILVFKQRKVELTQ